ncbi:MAG: LTA synthase family protein [Bacillota bacterium]|nr:LTA synthase family protein [Bacillota bacterium]
MKRENRILLFLMTLFFFLNIFLLFVNIWVYYNFGNVKIQEILFTLLSPTSGTDLSLIYSFILKALVPTIFIVILFILLVLFLQKNIKQKSFKFMKITGSVILIFSLLLNVFYTNSRYNILDYLNYKNQKTTIYNKKKVKTKKSTEYIGDSTIIYQNPQDIQIASENPNNLIYIYLESIENSFMDKNNGGIKEVNCLPELTQLAQENISFSNTDKLGGALPFTGTTWTIASMTAQLTGLPLKVDVANDMDKQNQFMPGAKTLSDFLHEQGYTQELMIGSQKGFAGTDKLFLQHGFDTIYDYNDLKSMYSYQKNNVNQWGFNDYQLFEFAKEELTKLGSSPNKFNFTMATIDCHTPNGFTCSNCPNTYKNQYENVYACQSKLVSNFIEWCQSQEWFSNTTIVLVGDHPTMAQTYIKDIPDSYQRTTYNCFINSKVKTTQIKNRQFTHMDMYPTTLAAIGFKINGNKLGLGTNLFSKLPTIIEKYGLDYINEEVQKSSEYLDKNIYQFN